MTFFSTVEPILRLKEHELTPQDQKNLWSIDWQIGPTTLLQLFFTRIDQVFLIWGLLTLIIFTTAQFLPIDWMVQADIWTVLALAGIVLMTFLSWCWAATEKVTWLIACWVIVIGVGVLLTYLSIINAWEGILLHLGPLWLILSACGYLVTGLALHSKALTLTAILHGLSALVFMVYTDWQFLGTGLIHAGSLFLLGAYQWDMYLIPEDIAAATKVRTLLVEPSPSHPGGAQSGLIVF
jgi:hypothetical protein